MENLGGTKNISDLSKPSPIPEKSIFRQKENYPTTENRYYVNVNANLEGTAELKKCFTTILRKEKHNSDDVYVCVDAKGSNFMTVKRIKVV